MVTRSETIAGRTLPLLVQADGDLADSRAWLVEHRDELEADLLRAGAILLRGFDIDSPERLQVAIDAVGAETLEYRERSSPRSQVLGNIYTSTDYPPQYPIFLHNENSYSSSWPLRLFFCCVQAAESGGETPIADSRRVYQRVPQSVRDRFERLGVMYVRNFHPNMGVPWSTSFQTEDRGQVESYCRAAGIRFEWLPDDRLRTRYVRPAVVRHPRTGELSWFNHATFFHVSTLEPMMREMLLASYGEQDLPNNTYYGDGSPIEDAALDELRAIYREETVAFPWQVGDLMLVDNMLAAHGRSSYRGRRKVLVAMSQPLNDELLARAAR